MRSFLMAVVLLVAFATGSFAQSAGQIQLWVNGAAPAPRLRFTNPPGRTLPAVRNCAPQFNGGNSSADRLAALAFLLQALASQQNGCQQQGGFGYGQPSGYVPQGYGYQPYADPAASAYNEAYQNRVDQLARQARQQQLDTAAAAGRRAADQQFGLQ